VPTALQSQFLAHHVGTIARNDFITLNQSLTVGEAIEVIRKASGGSGAIQYYYVVAGDGRLVGVLPLRRLITFPVDKPLREVMHARVIALPRTATVLDACEFFVLHKFLAFPVVDEARRVIGVIDVSQLTTDMIDLGGGDPPDDVFEALGFRIAQVRGASPVTAFRFRFPWLTATIGSGVLCALLTSLFEVTLAKSLVLAFFLTLVLGLAESVSIQSMTLTIQALHTMHPTWRWYWSAFRREAGTAALLGAASGVVVGIVVWFWRGTELVAVAIGGGISLALCAACFFGLSVPTVLHAAKLDPKIAAGPVTLAFTDISTLLFYFTIAALLL